MIVFMPPIGFQTSIARLYAVAGCPLGGALCSESPHDDHNSFLVHQGWLLKTGSMVLYIVNYQYTRRECLMFSDVIEGLRR